MTAHTNLTDAHVTQGEERLERSAGDIDTGQVSASSPRTEEDWIAAGVDLLAVEGARGVRISVLCERLGLTKGSFYWHFKSLSDFVDRILAYWRQRATFDIIDQLSAGYVNSARALATLLILPRRAKSPRAIGLEPSIRDWARRNEQANLAVKEIDQLRLDFFERMLRAQGLAEEQVRARAYIAYCIMMGDSILHRSLGSRMSDEDYLDQATLVLGIRETDAAHPSKS